MVTATTADPTTTAAACCAPLGAPSLSDADAEATARLFKALADPHRVKILNLLAAALRPPRSQPMTTQQTDKDALRLEGLPDGIDSAG